MLAIPALPPTARQRRKESRPHELLDAALDLFVEKGFAATRSEEVAARAGVSKGTLYLYYPSKEDLLKEVIRVHIINEIAQGMDIVRNFTGTSAELLAVVMRQWWERIGETRASGILKLMMSEVRNFPEIAKFYVDEVVTPSNALLAHVLRRGIEGGEFRKIDVEQVVPALVAPLLFLVMHKHSIGACSAGLQIDPARFITTQIDLTLRGLEAKSCCDAAPAVRSAQPRKRSAK